jgi:hypothetical protein
MPYAIATLEKEMESSQIDFFIGGNTKENDKAGGV